MFYLTAFLNILSQGFSQIKFSLPSCHVTSYIYVITLFQCFDSSPFLTFIVEVFLLNLCINNTYQNGNHKMDSYWHTMSVPSLTCSVNVFVIRLPKKLEIILFILVLGKSTHNTDS